MSLEVFSPAQTLLIVQTTAIHHWSFLPFFLFFFTLEFKKNFAVPSVLFYVLFCSILFSFQICFLLFLFSYYSILSSSPYVLLLFNLFSFLLFVIFESPLSYLFSIYFIASVFFFKHLLLVRILWYSCYLFPSSLLFFPLFSHC